MTARPLSQYVLISLCAILLMMLLGGCSGLGLFQDPAAAEKDDDTDKEKKQAASLVTRYAAPMPGQRDNPLYEPIDYSEQIEAVHDVLSELLEALKTNNSTEAGAYLHGLDEAGSVLDLTGLQQEVEILHPVSWRVEEYRPANDNQLLVTISFLWPDGSQSTGKPFTVHNDDGLWTVHFKSFANTFHGLARHLITERRSADTEIKNAVSE